MRSVLVVDVNKPATKPRLSWCAPAVCLGCGAVPNDADLALSCPRRYNPYDTTWIPSGWFAEGLKADVSYYFGQEMSMLAEKVGGAPLSATVQPNGA